MKKKNYNIIKKNILLYLFIIFFSNICLNDILEQEKYILNLFDEELYIDILTNCKKNTALNQEYQEILLKHFYDYYELKTKKTSDLLNNNLIHQMFVSFFNNVNIDELNTKSIDKKKILFNQFIEKNKIFEPVSYEMFDDLTKELSFLIDGYFKDIIEKGVRSSYSPRNSIPVSQLNNFDYITYDLLNDAVINSIPNGSHNLLFSEISHKGNFRNFEKIFHGKSKINIKFDLNQKEKKELPLITQFFNDLKEYAYQNGEIKIFCSFYNDGGITKEEIVLGDYNFLDYDDKRFSKINDLNIINVLSSHNKETLFRRVLQNKNNLFLINIPECLANKEYIQKKCIEFIEQSSLKMNNYVGYRIIKKNTNNNIYFIPASATPIYHSSHLILNKNNLFINNKKNNKKKDSLLLKKFIDYAKYSIGKQLKPIDLVDFIDFFNCHLFEEFIFLVCDKSNLSDNQAISFHSYEIENIIKGLIVDLINKIDAPEFMLNKQILSLPHEWNVKLISFLKDLNLEKNTNIIFEYTDQDKKYIEKYRGQEGYLFFNYQDIQEQRKNKIIQYIMEDMGGKNTEGNLQEELTVAYNEMLYPGIFSDIDLIAFTKEIYQINKNLKLNHKEKTFLRIDFISKFFRKISDAEIQKFNSFPENKNNKFFVNKNYDPSDKEINDLFNSYDLSDVDLEEVRYYLKEIYSEDTKKLKKIIWNIIYNNNYYFKKDKSNKKNNLASLKKIISSPAMDLCVSSMAIFNKRFQYYSGSGVLEKHYNQYKALNAKKQTEDRSIKMHFTSQKDLESADLELIPGILRCEIFKNIEVFKKNNGKSKCQLESVSGEPGLGKSNSFPFEIKAYKEACISKGIDPDNVEGIMIGGIGSSFMMAGSEQANDIWNIIDAAINEKPDIKICILFDECDKAFIDSDSYKRDLDNNSNNNGKDKFRLDFQTTWKDRFDPIYKHKNVSVKYCSNNNLELFLDPAIKSRSTGKEKILHITTLEASVIKRLLEKELHEKDINHDLELNYSDVQKIKFIIGNQQRNKDVFKEIINQFIQRFPNKKDQNRINFMSICELKYLNKNRQNYKKLLSAFDKKKTTNSQEQKSFEIKELLNVVPDSYIPKDMKSIFSSIFTIAFSPNTVALAAGLLGAHYGIKQYNNANGRDENNKIKDGWKYYGSYGAGAVLGSAFPALLCWDIDDGWESFGGSGLKGFWASYKAGFGSSNINQDFAIRPNYSKRYQNLDNISKIKSEDYLSMLMYIGAECATSKKSTNMFYDLEIYKKHQEEYLFGDADYNEDNLFALETDRFIDVVINARLKKMKEFELYIEKHCTNIKKFLEIVSSQDIRLAKNNMILSGEAVKSILFSTIFDGKKNDYIILEKIDEQIDSASKALDIPRRIIDYHNDVLKLKNNQLKNNQLNLIKLQHKINTEEDDLYNTINNMFYGIKLKAPIDSFELWSFWKMHKDYSNILKAHNNKSAKKDSDFSNKIKKELEINNKKEKATIEENDLIDDEDDE